MKLIFGLILICIIVSCKENKNQAQAIDSTVSDAFVTAIYPKQDTLPENILKFYIQFSEPMREGDFLKHIKLQNSKDENVTGVFFDNIYELWNNDHTQITLLVDPGRVKTGLQQNIKQGRAFAVNETYTLTIDTSWKTIKGDYLSKPFTKQFVIDSEDIIPPSIDDIIISKAKVKSNEPVKITFGEVLDVFQLQDYVRIVCATDVVKGKFTLLDDESSLQFTPQHPWNNIDYKLRIDVRLEDIAANSFAGKFDQAATEAKNFKQKGFLYKPIPIE